MNSLCCVDFIPSFLVILQGLILLTQEVLLGGNYTKMDTTNKVERMTNLHLFKD